jgi:deoxyribodipyrimidine photo-lyase
VLAGLHRDMGLAGLWSHEETGNAWTYARDQRVAAFARAEGITWTELRQTGVQRRLKNRNGWARAWDRLMAKPSLASPQALAPLGPIESQGLPSAADLGLAADPCRLRQLGGRGRALATLNSFLDERGRDYRRAMSTPVAGAEACSRLSPFLAAGAISMREVSQATIARLGALRGDTSDDARARRGSLVSFAGRLRWHCHFMQKLESEPRIEFEAMHPAYADLRPTSDTALLAAYTKGETGFPFVDACLRALAATGWMNFRMRAMLMSFASYNLWLPWRDSGLHLARQFTDYEPGIHWPQAQMQSGTTGINTIRVYNVVKQGYDQDPDGVFVRRWIPELAHLSDEHIHEPWTAPGAERWLGQLYPRRIVDHEASARLARERIYAVRRGPTFAGAADAIQERHGSRKSGLPMTGQTRAATRKAKPKAQIEMDV